MSGGRWIPVPLEWWAETAAALEASGESWPPEAARIDLRYYEDQIQTGARRRLPGRTALRRRWGWTDHRVRTLLQSESWRESPERRQKIARTPPENQRKEQEQRYPTARTSPENRQKIATRGSITINNKQDQIDPLPGGNVSREADSPRFAPPVGSRPSEAPVGSPGRLGIPSPLPAPLEALEGYREALEGYLQAARRSVYPSEVDRVIRECVQAEGEGLDTRTALRLATAKDWRGFYPLPYKSPSPASSAASEAPSAALEAWEDVRAGLVHWGRRAPGTGSDPWGFTSDPAEEARYLQAIRAAGESSDLSAAWGALYSGYRNEKSVKFARLRFVKCYSSQTHTQHTTHNRTAANAK